MKKLEPQINDKNKGIKCKFMENMQTFLKRGREKFR